MDVVDALGRQREGLLPEGRQSAGDQRGEFRDRVLAERGVGPSRVVVGQFTLGSHVSSISPVARSVSTRVRTLGCGGSCRPRAPRPATPPAVNRSSPPGPPGSPPPPCCAGCTP